MICTQSVMEDGGHVRTSDARPYGISSLSRPAGHIECKAHIERRRRISKPQRGYIEGRSPILYLVSYIFLLNLLRCAFCSSVMR